MAVEKFSKMNLVPGGIYLLEIVSSQGVFQQNEKGMYSPDHHYGWVHPDDPVASLVPDGFGVRTVIRRVK